MPASRSFVLEAEARSVFVPRAFGATISDVLVGNQVPLENCHLFLINGHYHHRDIIGSTQLTNGDTLAVWPPIAGG